MGLKIIKLHNTGNATEEYIELASDSVVNLGEYIVSDMTFDKEFNISNIDRHVYWFADKYLNVGDTAFLYTRPKGQFDEDFELTTSGAFKYFFFWGSKAPIWNDSGDTAYLHKTAFINKVNAPVKLRRQSPLKDLLK